MDIFFEQIIFKKLNTTQKVLKIAIIIMAIVLICSLFAFGVASLGTGSIFAPIIFIAAIGVGYGTVWYVKRMYIEYEYAITNGDFDVDRIIGKAKRERVISTSCKEFEEIGVYDERAMRRLKPMEFDAKVVAANLDEDGVWYIITNHSKAGRVLIYIQPNDKIISALKKFTPRIAQNDVFWN